MEDSRGEPGGFWVEVAGVVARGPKVARTSSIAFHTVNNYLIK